MRRFDAGGERGLPDGRAGATAGLPARTTVGEWYLLVLLVLGAFVVVLVGARSSIYDLDRYVFPKALVLHVTALLALPVLLPRVRRLVLGGPEGFLTAYVLWSGVSAVLARNWWLALASFGVSFSGLVLFFAARAVGRTRSRALVGALALAAALGSTMGVAQAYGADWSFLGATRPPGGTFGNRNFLAHLTAIAVPLLLLLRLRARGKGTSFVALLGLLAAAAAIVLTRSRAAWLGLAAGLAVMTLVAALGWRGLRAGGAGTRRLRGALLALALGAAAAVVLPNRLDWRSSNPYAETLTRITDYRGGSGKGRLVQYHNSLRMLRFDPVFGVGPGNWFVHYPRVTTRGDAAFDTGDPIPTNPWPSSDWVTFLVERGPVGALLLLAGLLAAGLACLRMAWSIDRNRVLAGAALAGALAATVVCGLFDAVLLLPAPTFFVFVAMGALLPEPARPAVDRPLGHGARTLVRAATIILALGLSAMTAGQLRALILTQASQSRRTIDDALAFDPGDYRLNLLMLERGSCSSRIRYARAAARLLPYHPAPRRALRACGVRPRPRPR